MSKQIYTRDGRAPLPEKDSISRIMSANRGKNTKPELILRRALWTEGLRGYRLHWDKAPGRPDIAYPKKYLAIFVNGCFWHRCPKCKLRLPKSHVKFWREKFERNVERDKDKIRLLKGAGWRVITVWECDINKNISMPLKTIKKTLIKQDYVRTS